MMLTYKYNQATIQITETAHDKDIEFTIRLIDVSLEESIICIKNFFEHNDIYTDVLFNVYENHEYQAFVRKDYYIDFILALMKKRLVEKVEWV
ncbi:MAG: hypothetical protein K0R71_1771 [Bacillales bacterium]|jgi:hypothetical protein|nr:hypothetical protein [Bacillales bacterium]